MLDLLSTYRDRRLLPDVTPCLAVRLARGLIMAYVRFDPTADSLHVGNPVALVKLPWMSCTRLTAALVGPVPVHRRLALGPRRSPQRAAGAMRRVPTLGLALSKGSMALGDGFGG